MKRTHVGVGVLAGVLVLAVAFLLHEKRNTKPDTASRADTTVVTEGRMLPTNRQDAEVKEKESRATHTSQEHPNFTEEFRRSRDYLVFARSTLGAAQAGDPSAQYYLGKALGFCDETYQIYFRRNKRRLTLDEALEYSAEVHRSRSETRTIYERCHELESQADLKRQFGNSSDWISKASDAGQPVAQATVAIINLQWKQLEAAGSAAASSALQIKTDSDPHTLLMAAVESKDPEALWYIGLAQGLLNPGSATALQDQYAWWLVSCQRGMDCSPDADWIQMSCQDMCGLSGPDFIRIAAGNHWQEVERRAQEIDDKVNAGDSSDLGLGT